MTVAGGIFFKMLNKLKSLGAADTLNALPSWLSTAKESLKELDKNETSKVKDLSKMEKSGKNFAKMFGKFFEATHSKGKAAMIALPFAMLAGGITKSFALKLNRIGSKEYKVENPETLDKKELKKSKKELKKQKRQANFKNFYTGALNGLMAPIATLAGGIVGIPAYIMGTTGVRYAKNKNESKDKSFSNFANSLKNNAVLNSVVALAIAIPMFKKASVSKVLSENLEKVVTKFKDVKLKTAETSSCGAFYDVKDVLFNSEKISHIMNNRSISASDKINELTKENIFSVKMLQILGGEDKVSSALVENCPPTRTLEEAQKDISKFLGTDNYSVSKLLGVGTVAESYLAKDKSGKEVCIKILKNGINAEKIQKDKESFINLVTNGASKEKLTQVQQYLVQNIENLADSVSKEVDFENELNAAKKLSKHTKLANVVVPIEAKPGAYVMEKASGISLDTLVKYYQNESAVNQYKIARLHVDDSVKSSVKFEERFKKRKLTAEEINELKEANIKDLNNEISKYEKNIEEIKAKSPDFAAFSLSENDIKSILNKYMDVLVEQLAKVEKNGKTLHADIHPGNIFIDVDALKNKKGNVFTLIDTGNTIDLTKEQAIHSLKLTSYLKNGNVKDLTKMVVDEVILPENMTKEQAGEIIEKELSKKFFDNKTNIDSMNIDSFYNIVGEILKDNNMTSADTQLALNKAKIAANSSLQKLIKSFFEKKFSSIDTHSMDIAQQVSLGVGFVKDFAGMAVKYGQATKTQEAKNMSQMSVKEIINTIRNKNMLKTNSEEHLTYKFKQDMQVDADNVNPFDM